MRIGEHLLRHIGCEHRVQRQVLFHGAQGQCLRRRVEHLAHVEGQVFNGQHAGLDL